MSGDWVKALPNALTFARLGMCAGLFALIACKAWGWALAVFALAAFTDWLDGYLARVLDASTPLGRMLDPLVDKVLMTGAFIFLLPAGMQGKWLSPWMVTVVTAREFLITGLRSHMEARGVAFGADRLGKLKMVLQCAAVAAALLGQFVPEVGLTRDCLIGAMLVATVGSGLQYVWRAARVTSPG
ncbi:MAG: CDP-diacylglycerol--glycerol-3-phosphate 3-phosphatidyltransferase [Gemmataceae bacterium]